ncbi:MAG: MBL fold metallo-hydrolase RNA specificity domain-containing protein [Verrucomicrobiota bacterium]
MPWDVEMRGGSLYLPQAELWCDAHKPVDFSFVSHAHFDHLAAHRRTSVGTRRLMAARMPGEREEIVLPFGEPYALRPGRGAALSRRPHFRLRHAATDARGWDVSLHRRLQAAPGPLGGAVRAAASDVVVMETTFGLPRYVFPPTADVLASIIGFCRQAIEDGEVPVLFGYSLGKSQEAAQQPRQRGAARDAAPADAEDDAHLRGARPGVPALPRLHAHESAGHVVVCPPQANNTGWLRKIKPRRTAMVTGWAIDPGAVYRYQCDAAFPLSDHADFADLLAFVERVQPKRVFTVHGFAEEFARTLRERGVEAWALGVDNQLEISLGSPRPPGAGPQAEKGRRPEVDGYQTAAEPERVDEPSSHAVRRLPTETNPTENAPQRPLAFATVAEKLARRRASWRRSSCSRITFSRCGATSCPRPRWPSPAGRFRPANRARSTAAGPSSRRRCSPSPA